MQMTSREKGIPIDTLGFEVHVLSTKIRDVPAPSEGVHIKACSSQAISGPSRCHLSTATSPLKFPRVLSGMHTTHAKTHGRRYHMQLL